MLKSIIVFVFSSFISSYDSLICQSVVRFLPDDYCFQTPGASDTEFLYTAASSFTFVIILVIRFFFPTARCSLGEYDSVLTIFTRRRTFNEQVSGLSNRFSIGYGLIRFGRAIFRDFLRIFPSCLVCRIWRSCFSEQLW